MPRGRPAHPFIRLPRRSGVDGVLVRFGEIGIKSAPVRRAMLERLRRNLLDLMEREAVEGDALRLGARLWLVGPDTPRLLDVATRTFGVVSASPALRVPATMESLSEAAVKAALDLPWTRFAIRCRREGTHAFSSQDVQVQVGSAVFVAAQAAGRSPKVDLKNPEVAVDIDIRGEKAFVFTEQREGPGGLPLGCQGRVVALVRDEASFVAAWLMARRGCHVDLLHAGPSPPLEAVAALGKWGMDLDIEVLPAPRVTKAGLLVAATRIAAMRKAQAIVTGDGLDSDLKTASLPVLRPVCGLDLEEYARWRDRIALPSEFPPRNFVRDPMDAAAEADALLAKRELVTA
jgi:adenylyl- and sulfurtransferase ThiI